MKLNSRSLLNETAYCLKAQRKAFYVKSDDEQINNSKAVVLL